MDQIIRKPHVTEKATDAQAEGRYTFLVVPSATKAEVKKAIHRQYRVDVTAVNMVNHPPKAKRFRGKAGGKSGRRLAIVSLKKGQKIEL